MSSSIMTKGLFLALAALGAATIPGSSVTCDLAETQTAIDVHRFLDLEYTTSQTEYWSTGCGALKPSCILMPTTTQEVAAVVSILNTNNETFAIKSGGHNPNNYFSSIDGGPLLSTKNLNQIILDPVAETVRVGPGNRWDDVSAALDGTGFTAVGGRIGNVGVGGYLLGGGLSFMSSQYGWSANSVLEFELVLANATIVHVRESNYPELFIALRGGGSNFGIVTSFLLKAYPQGQVWGGNLIFNQSAATTVALLEAVRDFTENYHDEKAAVIVTAERTFGTLVNLWVIFLYYNGPEPPAGVFDKFFAASKYELNTCKTQSMHSLVSGNNWAVVKGSIYTIGTETIPVPNAVHGPEVMQSFFDFWVQTSDTIKFTPGLIANVAFQPLPKRMLLKAQEKGGDLMAIDASVNRIVIELNYSFLGNGSYPEVDNVMRASYNGFRDIVTGHQATGKLPNNVYLPLFMNDCFYAQDYFGRLKPSMKALAQRVQAAVDPTGFWHSRTAGWKIR